MNLVGASDLLLQLVDIGDQLLARALQAVGGVS